ncbi:MAG: very short patch repair endonuclease [Bacteroidales bacterium]|jgi:DNA mismatch endonuclease Vsr|nr:very short patch repair endonuclease [Bacteroidales bacterium]
MSDIFTPEKRTSIMRSVKNKNTLPELIVQSLLRDIGVEYEREKKLLNCRPDIIISDMKKVILIHGCFWHGHECKRGQLPETNKSFWANKIAKNRQRDLKNCVELNEAGWDYLIIWGCEIKKKNLDNLINKIENFLS